MKHGAPPIIYGGGTVAKATFQPIFKKWHRASYKSMSVISASSSSMTGPSMTAFLNYIDQVGSCIAMYIEISFLYDSAILSSASLLINVTRQTFFFDILTPIGSGLSNLTLKMRSGSSSSLP